MISKWEEAQVVRRIVQSITLAGGETADARAKRIGGHVGVSPRTVWDWQDLDGKQRIGWNQMLRLLTLAPPEIRRDTLEFYCNAMGLALQWAESPKGSEAKWFIVCAGSPGLRDRS